MQDTDLWSKLAALIGAFIQHSRKENFLPFLSFTMKKSGWRDPLAADYVLRSTAQAHIHLCRFLLVNSTKVWECWIVFTLKIIFGKRDVWSRCHGSGTSFSRGYQLFCRQDCSFPAVLCNSKWLDHKFAVSCFVKGRSALNYWFSLGCLVRPSHCFSERCPLMATEEQGISSSHMRCQTRFSIYSSLSKLFIHDIFLSTQKMFPILNFQN